MPHCGTYFLCHTLYSICATLLTNVPHLSDHMFYFLPLSITLFTFLKTLLCLCLYLSLILLLILNLNYTHCFIYKFYFTEIYYKHIIYKLLFLKALFATYLTFITINSQQLYYSTFTWISLDFPFLNHHYLYFPFYVPLYVNHFHVFVHISLHFHVFVHIALDFLV